MSTASLSLFNKKIKRENSRAAAFFFRAAAENAAAPLATLTVFLHGKLHMMMIIIIIKWFYRHIFIIIFNHTFLTTNIYCIVNIISVKLIIRYFIKNVLCLWLFLEWVIAWFFLWLRFLFLRFDKQFIIVRFNKIY